MPVGYDITDHNPPIIILEGRDNCEGGEHPSLRRLIRRTLTVVYGLGDLFCWRLAIIRECVKEMITDVTQFILRWYSRLRFEGLDFPNKLIRLVKF